MKKLEDMTKEELYYLCAELLRDGAEVQSQYVEEYAKSYGVDW